MNRLWTHLAASALLLATASAAHAAAPAFPVRPVRIIVPFGPGGSTDIVARILGQKLTEAWGQQAVVDNRGGAGGIIASELVARAAPDGYTILMGTISTHGINQSLYRKIPYDPIGDFAPVTLVATTPSVLMVHPSVPAASVKELIALAKAKPGELNYGSAGFGGSQHLCGVLLMSLAGIKLTHVSYKDTAAALLDAMSGRTQVMFDSLPSAMPYIKSGKLRALAVTGSKRSPALPSLPTVAEGGVPGFDVTAWYGALVPAGTSKSIVDKLNADFVRAIRLPDVQERITSNGAEPVGSTPQEFAQFVRSELVKWAKVVKESGARAE